MQQARKARPAPLVPLGLKVPSDPLVLKVTRATKVTLAQLGLRVYRDPRAILAHRGFKVFRDCLVKKVTPDRQAQRDLPDLRASRV